MEAGFVVLVTIIVGISIIVGMRIERRKNRKVNTQGVIYAYCSDRESKPSLLLEYNVPIDDIISRKRVSFDVIVIK